MESKWREAKNWVLVDIPEPLVADNLAIFEVGDLAIVGLPVAFVQQDDTLLSLYVQGDGAEE